MEERELDDLKKAINKTERYSKTVNRDEKMLNFSVEELRESKSGDFWIITVGWDILKKKQPPKNAMQLALQQIESNVFYDRTSKVFVISKKTGEVEKMVNEDSEEFYELIS
ncbi:MAG: hypothetical protein FWH29_10575 [Methanobrevibacter sp.]|nr:hypothetical protein [Methanobrevibacter sp.]